MRIVTLGTALAVAGAAHAALNAGRLRRPGAPAPAAPVSVLIPARDEAERIGPLLASVAGQPGVAEVLVLDDESRDTTAALAAAGGARVLSGRPVPPGWLGKPWACAQLAAAATPASAVLVFLDADVRLAPGAIAAAVTLHAASGLDLMCPVPRQVAVGGVERLVQPLLMWSILTTLPLRVAERSRRPSLCAAVGQFVVVRRDVLERAGGFAAVRDQVLDDIALARVIKSAGGRAGVADGSGLARCRMYADWPQLRAGYAKSLWAAFPSPGAAAAVLAGLGLAYVVPPLAALRGSRAGALGYAAAVVTRVITARSTGGRAWPDPLAHPASVIVFGGLTVRSWWGRRRGTLVWKGRPVA